MSVWGNDLNGLDYNTKRDYGMTETVPPADYRWHHSTLVFGQGKDIVHTAYDTYAAHREMRQNWLDQFELVITEEGDYRVWTWYDGQVCRWSERRLLSDPLPKLPGFWPSDD